MTTPASIAAVTENSDRLGLTWDLRPATVTAANSNTVCQVLIDGDTNPIAAFTLVGPIGPGLRVQTVKIQPEGVYVVGFAKPQTGTAAVRVITASQGTLSGAGPGSIPWTSAEYDTHGFWDVATPTLITIPPGINGKFAITFEGTWDVTAGGGVRLISNIRNAAGMAAHRHPAIVNDFNEMTMATEYECAAGDVLAFQLYQTSGGSLNFLNASATVSYTGSVS